jgi:hypothetical protein
MELAIGSIEFDFISEIISAAENISSKIIMGMTRDPSSPLHRPPVNSDTEGTSSSDRDGPLIEVLDDSSLERSLSDEERPVEEPSEASTEPL